MKYFFRAIKVSPFDNFKSWRQHIRGRLQANYEYDHMYRASAEFCKSFRAQNLPQLAQYRSAYSRGWCTAWADHGYDDAKLSQYFGDKFENDEYDYGWLVGMKHMQKSGFATNRHQVILENLLAERETTLDRI
jgi:hypothetical protein